MELSRPAQVRGARNNAAATPAAHCQSINRPNNRSVCSVMFCCCSLNSAIVRAEISGSELKTELRSDMTGKFNLLPVHHPSAEDSHKREYATASDLLAPSNRSGVDRDSRCLSLARAQR